MNDFDYIKDPLERSMLEIESGKGSVRDWHVVWVVATVRGSRGIYTEGKQLSDSVEMGHPTAESATVHAKRHNYHRSRDAWVMNARTGETVLVKAGYEGMP